MRQSSVLVVRVCVPLCTDVCWTCQCPDGPSAASGFFSQLAALVLQLDPTLPSSTSQLWKHPRQSPSPGYPAKKKVFSYFPKQSVNGVIASYLGNYIAEPDTRWLNWRRVGERRLRRQLGGLRKVVNVSLSRTQSCLDASTLDPPIDSGFLEWFLNRGKVSVLSFKLVCGNWWELIKKIYKWKCRKTRGWPRPTGASAERAAWKN